MSQVIDPPAARRLRSRCASVSASQTPAERLRDTTAALRVSFTWFGTRKTLTPEQKSQAAESFGAEGQFLSAGKKLLDTKHPAFRTLGGVKHAIVSFWRGVSLPFPEPGIRLIRQRDVASVQMQLTTMRQELVDAVQQLDQHFDALKATARERLGTLFNPADYPDSLRSLFDVAWDFPNVEPPSYLEQLSPELYRQESQRVAARFDEAIQLAETAFIEELSRLVSHLTERISGSEDGQPKVFRDSAIANLTEFFQRFRELNVRSNAQLDELVEQSQRIVRGVEPQTLRDNETVRQNVATQLSAVQSVLDGLMVDRPRRNILRRPR
jgi:hypothetical protein